MKKKVWIVVGLLAIFIVAIVLGSNMYKTKCYSYSWGKAKMHISEEEVRKITCSYIDSEGEYILLEYETEEELAVWKDFFASLNETTFTRNVSLFGRNFCGITVQIELKDVKEEFRITFVNETLAGFNRYSWTSSEEIELPVEWKE